MNQTVAAAPVEIERVIDATLAETWSAWTEPALVARWFAPGTMRAEVLAFDVHAGGKYRIRMHDDDGSTHTVGGEFVEVVPQRKLVMTWVWEGDDTTRSTVSVGFEKRSDGTQIRIVHEELPSDDSASKHEQGWLGCLENLRERIGTF